MKNARCRVVGYQMIMGMAAMHIQNEEKIREEI